MAQSNVKRDYGSLIIVGAGAIGGLINYFVGGQPGAGIAIGAILGFLVAETLR